MDDLAKKTSKNRVLNFAKFCNGFLDENELQFEFCSNVLLCAHWSHLNNTTNHTRAYITRDYRNSKPHRASLDRGPGTMKKHFMYPNENSKVRDSSVQFSEMGAARVRLSPIGFVVIGLVVVAVIYYLSTDGGIGEFSHKYFEGEDTVSMKKLIVTAIHLAEKGGVVVRKIRNGEDLGVSNFLIHPYLSRVVDADVGKAKVA